MQPNKRNNGENRQKYWHDCKQVEKKYENYNNMLHFCIQATPSPWFLLKLGEAGGTDRANTQAGN